MGVERGRRRRRLRHPDVVTGGDARAGAVLVRDRAVRRRAGVVRPRPPPHRHSRQRLGGARPPHGRHCPLHRPPRPPQPRLHRHPLRLLHGRQRRHLPPLRRPRRRLRRPALADARLPRRLLGAVAALHPGLAVRAAGGGEGGHARGLHRRRRRDGAGVRVPGAAGQEAGAVGRATHAMGAHRLHLPQPLLAGLAGPPVLHTVRRLLGCGGGRVPAVQRAC